MKFKFLKMLFIVSLMALAAACSAPAADPAVAPAAGSEASTTSESAASGDQILRIVQTARIPAPDIWNPYIPGTFILQGMNQNMMEPLFMLNYETGEIDGWLAESYSANDDLG